MAGQPQRVPSILVTSPLLEATSTLLPDILLSRDIEDEEETYNSR